MDFIERWLHLSPDGGSGVSEVLVTTAIVATLVSLIIALRHYLPRNFVEFLEQRGKRENSDRFDN